MLINLDTCFASLNGFGANGLLFLNLVLELEQVHEGFTCALLVCFVELDYFLRKLQFVKQFLADELVVLLVIILHPYRGVFVLELDLVTV